MVATANAVDYGQPDQRGVIIGSSGTEIVQLGGVASSNNVQGGGTVQVSGGTTIGDVLIGSGGGVSAVETVLRGGVTSHATLSNTAVLVVSSGGHAVSTLVLDQNVGSPGSNGSFTVASGGSASFTVISGGGLMFERGADSGTVISSAARSSCRRALRAHGRPERTAC